MELKQFLHAKRAKNRVVESYRRRVFIGLKRPMVKPFRFKSYFAHLYTTRDYLRGIDMPHGACLSVLSVMSGNENCERMERSYCKWLNIMASENDNLSYAAIRQNPGR